MPKGYTHSKITVEKRYKKLLEEIKITKHLNYDFTNSIFKGDREEFTFRCKVHDKEVTVNRPSYLKWSKNGCPECQAEFTEFYKTEEFINKSKRLFKSKYEYSKTSYKESKELVIITCIKHGDFKQTPSSHLQGRRGCKECCKEDDLKESYSRTGYISKVKADTSSVYVIKIIGNNESFYKIGLTCETVQRRFRGKQLPDEYTIKVEHIFNDLDKGIAYDFEKLLHKVNKKNKYKPLIKFAGHTECFTQVPKDIKNYLDLLETIQ